MTIRAVAVVGAGTMGRGIAQVSAQGGYETHLYDANAAVLETARDGIDATLEKGVERGKLTAEERAAAVQRLALEADFSTAVAGADLVVEAVPENLDLKREIFARLDEECGAGAILATNTSSLSIGAISDATGRPERVIGLHFFNPVHIMKLVEIVISDRVAEDTLEAARTFARSIGKEPIVVRDVPGFATSRLGVAIGLEAMRMVEDGVATVRDIDLAMELGYNHPMGPLKLTDLVGLDVRLAIAEHLADTIDRSRFEPPEILRRLVAEGKLGRKSDQGFYTWREGKPVIGEE